MDPEFKKERKKDNTLTCNTNFFNKLEHCFASFPLKRKKPTNFLESL